MPDEQLNDLKQFFRAEVMQSEARIKAELTAKITSDLNASLGGQINELRHELRAEIGKLRQEMREGFASIGDIDSSSNDQLDNHETHITILESKAAHLV